MSMYETEYEGSGEAVFESWEMAAGSGQGEAYETELAMELLEITSEEELEEFLGKLVSRAVKAGGKFLKSGVGKAIGGVLKNVAKTALPMVGSALGSFVAPGIGTAIGGKLGSMASKLLEVNEAEMLGEEEAELEAARRYVRFAQSAVRNAAIAPPNVSPRLVARAAAVAAARRHAPALLRSRTRTAPPRWRSRRTERYGSNGPHGSGRGGGDVWSPWPVQEPTPRWDEDPGAMWGAGQGGGGWGNAWDQGSWDSGWGGAAQGDPFAGATYETSSGLELQ